MAGGDGLGRRWRPPSPRRSPPDARDAPNRRRLQQQPVVVVAPEYCLPHAVSLAVTKTVLPSGGGDWTISDAAGNIFFTVDGKVRAFGNRRHIYLLNGAGYKVIHMERIRKVFLSYYYVWHINAGDSEQLICTVKESSILQPLFLALNTTEEPDFTFQGNFFRRNLTIFRGQQTIAKVTQQTNPLIDKYTFGVTVFPGGDCAFVSALLAIHLHNGQ